MTIMARVRTVWSGSASAGSLSTHYFGPDMSITTGADNQACVDRVRDFWTALNPGIATGVNWTCGGVVDFINTVDGALVNTAATTARTGTGSQSGDPLPFQNQGLIQWLTATIVDGHRLRGHTYIPVPMEAESAGGVPNSTYTGRLATASAALLASGTFGLVVWHRPVFDAGGSLVRNGTNAAVTGGVGKGSWSVLRSRR